MKGCQGFDLGEYLSGLCPYVYLRRHREADGRGHQDVVDEEVTSRQRASAYAAAWPPLGGPDVGQEGPEPQGLGQD